MNWNDFISGMIQVTEFALAMGVVVFCGIAGMGAGIAVATKLMRLVKR